MHPTTRTPLFAACVPCLFLALSFGAGPASAQDAPALEPSTTTAEPTFEPEVVDNRPKEFRFELGAYGGGHFFAREHGLGRADGDPIDKAPDHGGAFGLRLAFNFSRWLALEAEGQLTPTRTNDDQQSLLVFGYRGHLLVHLLPPGVFRPFVLGGYGALSSLSKDEEAVPSDVDGLFHFGLGFKIAFTPIVGLRIDGRILVPPSIAADVVKVGNETGYGGPDFEVLGGIYIALGKPLSQVVVQKEVIRLPPPPNPDPDGDGVVGSADRCPEVAEDKDGFEDDDGCPDNDNDKDGIPDATDKCPLKPETMNGIDDEDGCPEEDTDGDGILGSRDKCPDQPETKNNYKDDDGCPDEIPPELKKFTGVIQGINFKLNSATILKGSFPLLNRAVKVLTDYPDVRLEIGGHTDNRGKADYNRDLSQKRADSVKNYLVSKGIGPDRLEAVGYGLDRPVASNKTQVGRSKNRRTEFTLIGNAPGSRPGGAPGTLPTPPPPGPPKP